MHPTLLIATPQLQDPFFERTVILLWHHDEDGAIGVVVNRPMEHHLPDVLDVGDDIDLSPYAGSVVGWGGPVESGSGTVVSRATLSEDEGWTLPGGLSVTKSQEALLRLIAGREDLVLCLGYAGWGPGQLESEIRDGSWLLAHADPQLLFETPAEQRWERAIGALGLSPHLLWTGPANA